MGDTFSFEEGLTPPAGPAKTFSFEEGQTPPAPTGSPGVVTPFLKGLGENLAGLGEMAGLVTSTVARAGGEGAQNWAFEHLVNPMAQAREKLAPTAEESASTAASVARGIGGLLPTLAEVAASPEGAALTWAAKGGMSMLRMGIPAVQAAVTQAADAAKAGDDLTTAYASGGTAGVMTAAMGIVPLSLKGGMLTRAVTGAASGLATGEVQRDIMNEVLSGHPDQQIPFSAPGAITNATIGALLGTVLGPRPEKVAIQKSKDALQQDLSNPDGPRPDEPPAPPPAAAPEMQEEMPPYTPIHTPEELARTRAMWAPFESLKQQIDAGESLSTQPKEAPLTELQQEYQAHLDNGINSLVDAHAKIATELKANGIEPSQPIDRVEFARQAREEAKAPLSSADIAKMYTAHLHDIMGENLDKGQAYETAWQQEKNNPAQPTAMGQALESAMRAKKYQEAFEAAEAQKRAQEEGTWTQHRGMEQLAKGESLPVKLTAEGPLSEVEKVRNSLGTGNLEHVTKMPRGVVQEVTQAIRSGKTMGEQVQALEALRDSKKAGTQAHDVLTDTIDRIKSEHQQALADLSTKVEPVLAEKAEPIGKSMSEAKPGEVFELAGIKWRKTANGVERVQTEGTQNAIQEPSTSSVLQHPQEGTGEAGGKRERVEPSQQGNKAPEENAGQGNAASKEVEVQQIPPKAAPKTRAKGAGRTEGTTDDRHTVAPPQKAEDLWPIHMTLQEARAKGPYAERAWWQDAAWIAKLKQELESKPAKPVPANEAPSTKKARLKQEEFHRAALEDSKITDEQLKQAPDISARLEARDALLNKMRADREAARARYESMALDEEIKAVENSKDAAERAGKMSDLMDMVDEIDREYPNEPRQIDEARRNTDKDMAASGKMDEPDMVEALKSGDIGKVFNAIRVATGSKYRTVIDALQKLNLQTKFGFHDKLKVDDEPGWIAGRYWPARDWMVIHRGGANAETVVHELVHAATLAKIHDANSIAKSLQEGTLKWSDLSRVQQVEQGHLKELTDIYLDAVQAAARTGDTHYGLTNLHEFVAETYANPEFQAFLKGAPEGLWTRVVRWVKNFFGVQGPENMLDKALSASEPFFTGKDTLGPSTMGIEKTPLYKRAQQASNPKATGAEAGEGIDGVLSGALDNFNRLADNAQIAKMTEKTFKSFLGWPTVGFILQRVKATPGLAKIVEPFKALSDAYDMHRGTMKQLEGRAAPYARALELRLHAIKNANERRQVSYNMMMLGGEGGRLGVEVYNDWATNLVRDPTLKDTVNKQYFEQLHRQYKSMEKQYPWAAKAIREGAEINKQMYIDRMATRVRDIIQSSPTAGLKEHVFGLDFKLGGMDAKLKEVFDAARGLGKGESDLREMLGEQEKIYNNQTAAPYYHIGRNGDYFVRAHFDGLDQDTADRLNNALKDHGKVLGDLKAMQEHGVFFRTDTLDQAQGIKNLIEKIAYGKLAKLENGYNDIQHGGILNGGTLNSAAGLNAALTKTLNALTARVDTLGLTDAQAIAMKQAVHRDFMSMLPETSSRKALMKQKGVPGYEGNFLQNFASRMTGMVQDHATAYTAPQITGAFKNMRDAIDAMTFDSDGAMAVRARDIHDELATRYANSMQPVKAGLVNMLTSFGHSFYLALSSAFLIRTSMQVFHRGLPIVGSKFGFMRSFGEIKSAAADVLRIIGHSIMQGFKEGGLRGILDTSVNLEGANLSPKEKEFMQWMHDMGEWDIGQAHQLARMATGGNVRSSDAIRLASIFAQYAEMTNRMVIGLAAFRLAEANTEKIGATDSHQYAKEVTRNTMDTFESDQTARQLGNHGFAGPVTPLMTEFMQYSAQTMQQVFRTVHDGMFNQDKSVEGIQRSAEAKREFAGLMGTTMMLSGAMGLPFVTVFAGLYNWLTKDANNPHDVREVVRNFFSDHLGTQLGEVLAHGPSRALGVDLSTTGLQNLLPGSEFLADRRLMKDRLESQSQQVLGPALNAGIDLLDAASKFSDGYYVKAVEAALPTGLKAPYKAAELALRGYTDSKGNPLSIKATPWDMFVQATGFTPAQAAERNEAAQYYNTDAYLRQHQKQVLSDMAFKAIKSGDQEGIKDAMENIREFNQANPIDAIRDLPSLFREHALALATGQSSGTGIGVESARQYPNLQSIRFANIGKGMK